jgi:hypothetical protein
MGTLPLPLPWHTRAETLQTLLRNTEYVSYATSAGRVYNYIDEAESKFNEVCVSS